MAWVEGSPVENTIWRGWPALVRARAVTGTAPGAVSLRGAAEVPLVQASQSSTWVLTASESARLALGNYLLAADNEKVPVTVVEPPAPLTPAQRSLQSRLLMHSALLARDLAAARQAADAWVQAEPTSPEAHEARGDVLAAAGDANGALAAYHEAAKRQPPAMDPPPRGLSNKINVILRQRAAPSPSSSSPAAPSVDEVEYFNLIDAGDTLLAADKRPEAGRKYGEAAALHRSRNLSVSTLELDEKLAFLGAPAIPGAAAPGMTPNAAPTPATRSASAGSSPATPAGGVATAISPAPTSASSTVADTAEPSSPPLPGSVVPVAELAEAKILADPNGQWTASAQASSEYGTPNYGAMQLVGAPNVTAGGDSTLAWCHGASEKGRQWIELTFAKPVRATEVRVRQSYNPGAIVKIEAFGADNSRHPWWNGIDPARPPGALNAIAWFAVRVPQTGYLVSRIRVTLDIDAVASWQQIDAVQLVGTAP